MTAIDSKANVINIGTVTTNGYYGTFGMSWTPPSEDTYTITATFTGDDSYGSSWAETHATVDPAPETPSNQQEMVIPDYTMTILGVGIAVIIAIVISVAIAVLILRKR